MGDRRWIGHVGGNSVGGNTAPPPPTPACAPAPASAHPRLRPLPPAPAPVCAHPRLRPLPLQPDGVMGSTRFVRAACVPCCSTRV